MGLWYKAPIYMLRRIRERAKRVRLAFIITRARRHNAHARIRVRRGSFGLNIAGDGYSSACAAFLHIFVQSGKL